MKLNLKQIVDIRDALTGIMASDRETPINVEAKVRFGLIHNYRKVKGHASDYDETRSATIKKHLSKEEKKKGDEAGLRTGTPEFEACKKELDESLAKEIEADLWTYPESEFVKATSIPMVFLERLIDCGIIVAASEQK